MNMIRADEAIISPIPGDRPGSIGPRCAMVGNPKDVDDVCALADLTRKNSRRLFLSKLYYTPAVLPGYSVIGSFIGAPYAVMLLETAITWGVREMIFFGWCGSVSPEVQVGDIIVPDLAMIDEGTSANYLPPDTIESRPSYSLQNHLKKKMRERNIRFQEGAVWTTDAIFRETQPKIAFYQKKGALCVDMETSALFSVGLFRNIRIGCVLVVSDQVSAGKWVQGFAHPKFKISRQQAGAIVCDFLTSKKSILS
ncbi:MAG: nucleoside phosphorylase [Desulfobacterales bacterium]|jgi:uridine phosphorylase|nr:nucleoside phosphorylase [Desulfobacterales bacterium]